ncbi:bifunctional UDP-sugar hydrolase/5'-nucleotidase [Lysinibacillus sp. KU-BSD001]|uniref:bifunctional metallophosphatase/5'-nucleotidase n=1 Tax=Lysinibacillus sp. KU-BSD001 TaxID=3141328 RepID=UPI0036E441D8
MIKISILATSDLHGYLYPTDYRQPPDTALGLAKIATYIEQKRTQQPTLLIDNGDLIQGSPLTYYYHTKKQGLDPMVTAVNALHIDAAVFGNHEFNYGKDYLQQVIEQSHFPWLACNILTMDGTYWTKPYIFKELAGLRIALIGATTHFVTLWENPTHIEGLQFVNAFEAVKSTVEMVRPLADIVIVSYHGGFECDLQTGEVLETSTENEGYRMCQEIDGIDVLISGHQHREIATFVHGKPVVQSGSKGSCLAEVELTIAGQTIIAAKPQLHYVDTQTKPYYPLLTHAQSLYNQTEQWLDTTIGTINAPILVENPFEARLQGHPFIDFIHRVQLEASGAQLSTTALFHNGVSGFNTHVTMRDIVSSYIYPNTLKVLRLTGQDILDALEQCATYFEIKNNTLVVSPTFKVPKDEPYNYDLWAGIEYEFTISNPRGNRVTKALYNGETIDVHATFDVVMNNYRATGAGNFPMFKNKPIIKDIQIDMTELIGNYFYKYPVVEATWNHNLKVKI